MLPPALKKRKAIALRESNGVPSKKKTTGKKKSPSVNKSQSRSISKIVNDVFSTATDSFLQKQRRGSTAPNPEVQNKIRRNLRPKPKADDLDEDEVSVEDQPIDDEGDPASQNQANPGPVFQAVNSKLGDRTFVKKGSSAGAKGKVPVSLCVPFTFPP